MFCFFQVIHKIAFLILNYIYYKLISWDSWRLYCFVCNLFFLQSFRGQNVSHELMVSDSFQGA